jgi:hypothetical protein
MNERQANFHKHCQFFVMAQNTLVRAIVAIDKWWDRIKEKNGWISLYNELGLPFMLLVILVIALYVVNDCNWTLPHYG